MYRDGYGFGDTVITSLALQSIRNVQKLPFVLTWQHNYRVLKSSNIEYVRTRFETKCRRNSRCLLGVSGWCLAHASPCPSHKCILIVLPSLWLPLQTTSRRCRPAPCSRASSPSWASSCSWPSSSPSPKDRGSPSPASFSSSHVSIFICLFIYFWLLSISLHFPQSCPHRRLLPSRPVHHDRSLHLHRPLPHRWERRLVRSQLHPGLDRLRFHVHLLHHLLCAT